MSAINSHLLQVGVLNSDRASVALPWFRTISGAFLVVSEYSAEPAFVHAPEGGR